MTSANVENSHLDRALLALERIPAGRWLAAVAAAVALTALSLGRASLGTVPTYLGKSYAALSLDPFTRDPSNPVGYRILTPLISHVVGLPGRGIIVTNLLFSLALLALVYDWLRREGHAPSWALLGAAIPALTMVTLGTLHYGGYSDVLTHLLVFAAWRLRARAALCATAFFLALFNHESALFLLPWLMLVMWDASAGRRHRWAGWAALILALGAWIAVRRLLDVARPGVEYSEGYYLRPLLEDPLRWYRASSDHRMLGVFAAFGLFWIFPLLAAARLFVRRSWSHLGIVLMPLLSAYATLFIAYDVTRMMALAFMGVLLGAEHLFRSNAFRAREWAYWLALLHYFVPQINVAMGRIGPMR